MNKERNLLLEGWWITVLENGSQIQNMDAHPNAPSYVHEGWCARVPTDILHREYEMYVKQMDPGGACPPFEKSHFMKVLYPLTGAGRTRSRVGAPKGQYRYVAKFQSLEHHQAVFLSARGDV